MRSTAAGLLLLLLIGPVSSARAETLTERLVLQFPGKGWAVNVAPPGFEFGEPAQSSAGRIWAAGDALEPGLSLIVRLEPAETEQDAAACLEMRLAGERSVARYSRGAMEVAEVALREYRGARVDRRQLAVGIFRDGICVYLELTKLDFVRKDRKFFEQLLDSIKLVEAAR